MRPSPAGRAPRAALLALLVGGLVPTVWADAEKRLVTETDLFRFVWVADPQISPDGKRVAFVRVSVSAKKDGYDTAIWVAPVEGGEAPRVFTHGPSDSSPRWSPDGSRLAFLRSAPGGKEAKPDPPQIHLIPAGGGEALALTSLPKGASSPVWSPDGRSIAFTSTTTARDLEKTEKHDKEESDEGPESDVRVITRGVYRFNGAGYLDFVRPVHLWTVALPAEGSPSAPTPVTSGEFSESSPAWSPDGKLIYFVSTRVKEPYYDPPDSDLYSVPAVGGEIAKVASIDGSIGDYTLSADGRRVAFLAVPNGHPVRSYDQPDLFVAETSGGAAPRNLTVGYDYDVGAGLTGDQRAPRGAHPAAPVWSRDQRSVLVRATEKGRANLKRVDATDGTVEDVTVGDQEVMSYTASPDGTRFAMVVSSPTMIGDLFLLEATSGQMKPLYHGSSELVAELKLTAPEELWYQSFDGKRIQAWVQKPPDFDKAKKYPLILNIHGGPHAAYGYTFDHEFQWMAAKGYVVLYPNPRGSSAYGQDFGNVIQYRYPGDDYKDLMAGVDELVRRGYVDARRLGVTGGSGGGVLTNWTITQTDRFSAAVSQRSIADWASWWYTADFWLFRPAWFRGAPFEQAADFTARSAISHIGRVKTPLMLIEGEADERTPPSAGGEQMFRALKYLKKPTVMVRFPGETHELSRSGGPRHRVERLQHIVAWFDKYLLGRATDLYDVP
jgi:dipeptidyl aminopeptidase/acylaminoacyl peptidase